MSGGHGHSPLAQFKINPVVDLHVAGYDLSITNSTIFLLAVTFGILLFFSFGLKKSALVPGRFQALIESMYEFISGTVKDSIGTEGIRYLPFVFSLFILILGLNLVGMLPYSFTVTSHIATTFALALFCFLVVNIIGFAKHGLHYLHLFVPQGIPKIMIFVITPIEVISYLIRPFSLAIRLAVAMTAGHVIMKIFAGFVLSLSSIFILLGILPLTMAVGLVGLELLVCFIQAFVFSILICIYLNDAVNMH
jgi:F-type H+-transporting ATPase subunit a